MEGLLLTGPAASCSLAITKRKGPLLGPACSSLGGMKYLAKFFSSPLPRTLADIGTGLILKLFTQVR